MSTDNVKSLAAAVPRDVGELKPLMRAAVDKGPDGIDMLERLLEMQERMDARAAEREFARSMVGVHRDMPDVVKTARNDQTRSFYARLEDIDQALRPVYSAHGFAVLFAEAECATAGWFRLTCTVMHEAGHSVTSFGDFPHDTLGPKGNAVKSALHGKGSTLTYGRRYLLTGAFNCTPMQPDRDGNAPPPRQPAPAKPAGPRLISDAQRVRLRAMQTEAGMPDETIKSIVHAAGFSSSKLIELAAYEGICTQVQKWRADAEVAEQATAGETIDQETGELLDREPGSDDGEEGDPF